MIVALRRAVSILFPLLALLLPWQITYIVREGELDDLFGMWQYGVIQFFAVEIFILGLLACGFFLARKETSYKRISWLESAACILLGVWAFVALLFASDPLLGLQGALRLCEGIGVYWLARTSQYSFRALAVWWVIGASIQSGMAIQQFSAQQIDANTLLGISFHSSKSLGDAVVENADTRWLRAYGSFPHPNILALYLVFGLSCAFWLLQRVEQKIMLYALLIASAVISAGLFFTFSRDAWVSLAVALLLIALTMICRRFAKKNYRIEFGVLFSPALVAFLACSMTLATLSFVWWEVLSVRLGVSGWHRLEQKSLVERQDGFLAAFELAPKHLEGVGIGNYTRVLATEKKDSVTYFASQYQPVHVVPLLVLLELGLVGLTALVSFVGIRLWQFFVVMRSRSYRTIGFVPLLIIPLFSDHFYWTLFPGILMWWLGWGLLEGD